MNQRHNPKIFGEGRWLHKRVPFGRIQVRSLVSVSDRCFHSSDTNLSAFLLENYSINSRCVAYPRKMPSLPSLQTSDCLHIDRLSLRAKVSPPCSPILPHSDSETDLDGISAGYSADISDSGEDDDDDDDSLSCESSESSVRLLTEADMECFFQSICGRTIQSSSEIYYLPADSEEMLRMSMSAVGHIRWRD